LGGKKKKKGKKRVHGILASRLKKLTILVSQMVKQGESIGKVDMGKWNSGRKKQKWKPTFHVDTGG